MEEELKVIVFKLGSEEYGIEVDKVQTIERMMPITRVPKTLSFVKGLSTCVVSLFRLLIFADASPLRKRNTQIKHGSSLLVLTICRLVSSLTQPMTLSTLRAVRSILRLKWLAA